MNLNKSFLTLLLALVVVMGCAPVTYVTISGKRFKERDWINNYYNNVAPLATFDLACPEADLHFEVLTMTMGFIDTIGVSGCGKRATYARQGSSYNFQINSIIQDNAPPAE